MSSDKSEEKMNDFYMGELKEFQGIEDNHSECSIEFDKVLEK